jgi:hypothetical protein
LPSGINVASVCRIVKRVSHAIASLKPDYIQMPTVQAADNAKKQFYDIAQFPGVIQGA